MNCCYHVSGKHSSIHNLPQTLALRRKDAMTDQDIRDVKTRERSSLVKISDCGEK